MKLMLRWRLWRKRRRTTGVIEWINSGSVELARYDGPLTERVLLHAIHEWRASHPGKQAKFLTLSAEGCTEYLNASTSARRYAVVEEVQTPLGVGVDEIRYMAPGVNVGIEVSFGMPEGFFSVA